MSIEVNEEHLLASRSGRLHLGLRLTSRLAVRSGDREGTVADGDIGGCAGC